MKIVIDIPEDVYAAACVEAKREVHPNQDYRWIRILRSICDGTPLPKGHGDLVDRSKICKAIYAEEDNCTGMGMTLEEMEAYNDGIDDMYRLVQGEPTIIEADNAESEE